MIKFPIFPAARTIRYFGRLFGILFLAGLCYSCKPQLTERSQKSELVKESMPETVVEGEAGQHEESIYPIERTVYNNAGKPLEGEIVGKDGDDIAFRRKVDGEVFLVSLFSLRVADTLSLSELPDGNRKEVAALRPLITETSPGNRPDLYSNVDKASDGYASYEEALAKAKESGKPVLMIFTGQYFGQIEDEETEAKAKAIARESQSMVRTVVRDSWFRAFAAQYTEFLHVELKDEDEMSKEMWRRNNSLSGAWQVAEFPVTILVNQNGREMLRIKGYHSASELRNQIDQKMGW